MIQEINLCLVNACNANCIFCPRSYHESKGERGMPLDVIEELIRQVNSDEFKEKHNLLHMHIGENGESTLHSDFLQILEKLKKEVECSVDLFTNFSNLTPLKSIEIVTWRLLSAIHVNIDGLDSDSYKRMKDLSWDRIGYNMRSFLRAKDEIGWEVDHIPLYIHVITLGNYQKAVQRHFGVDPGKIPENYYLIVDEAEAIKKKWEEVIGVTGVSIDDCLMWAERETSPKREGDYTCTNLGRVETNVFLNPNGDWYICCFDIGNELILGNIFEQTLCEIYESERRSNVIAALKARQFDEIGSPCNRVDCCQVVNPY